MKADSMNAKKEIMTDSQQGRRGQALMFVTLSLTVVFGLSAMVFDMGVIYHDQSALTASTQAAALAGAEAMSQPGATTDTVSSVVTTYSSVAGDQNASPFLSGASLVSGYPMFSCLSTLTTAFGTSCYGPSNSNAIVVRQKVAVPLFFLRIFGGATVELNSTATASMRGASVSPFNVAVIVDTTQSMNTTDSDSNCHSTRISCALSGVQVLLNGLSPCAQILTNCGTVTGGNVSGSVDRVSLLTFPPVAATSLVHDLDCLGTLISTAAYTSPLPLPAVSTYQVVNFSSDYKTSDTGTLSTASNLVKAVKGPSGTPCLEARGGQGTYLAQAITVAQAALVTEKTYFPTSQNVMIVLSDGDSSASCTISLLGVCTVGQMPGASTTTGTYMSTIQQCHQAITAANAATNAGTRVYTVAYGAKGSGCVTDTSPSITPCQTMEQMASAPGYFFSDYTATGGSSSCISASQPVSSLNQIFQVIAGDLTVSKLIPNGTT
jgi:Putative Tad-like Flp pilus-assembly